MLRKVSAKLGNGNLDSFFCNYCDCDVFPKRWVRHGKTCDLLYAWKTARRFFDWLRRQQKRWRPFAEG